MLGRLGIYYSKRRYMPRGIEWLWDLQRLLPTETVRTVIDVGANEGMLVRALLKTFPQATVHAFEPVAGTFEILRERVGGDPRVRVNRQAVSARAGTLHIRADAISVLSQVVPASAASDSDVESVDAVTLDSYCAQHGIEHIAVLKSDTEGHDLQVLKGAQRLLAEGRVDWVFVEVTFDPNNARNSLFGPIHDWLQAHGMAVWCIYDSCHMDAGSSRTPEDPLPDLMFCNVLFAKRSDAQSGSVAGR